MALDLDTTALEQLFGPMVDAAIGRGRWDQVQLAERLVELELRLDSEGWLEIGGGSQREFSRGALSTICQLTRLYFLKNPLIKRGVTIQAAYVYGQGITVTADDPDVNTLLQEFLEDARNRAEWTSHQARLLKEIELQLFGNLFFVLFTSSKGRVIVRTIPFDEIEDIIADPDDAKTPRYYKRVWQQQLFDVESGETQLKQSTAWYPDWRYLPKTQPAKIGGAEVMWDAPIYHVKTGGLSDMKFGVPEVYAALDWAKAYKKFLEDWASIVRAYSRFAWRLSVRGKTGAVGAAKAKAETTAVVGETPKPPIAGSTFIAGQGADLQPIRTAGATTSAEDGRRLLLMVAAVMGLPESFYGDVSVGTLATAKSLDRPTELRFRNRQSLWSDVYVDIARFQLRRAVAKKIIKGKVEQEEDGTPIITLKGTKKAVAIHAAFPPILEHDIKEAVAAIVQAATLGSPGMLAGTIPDMKTVSRMLLTALGEQNVDAMLDTMFPEMPEDVEGIGDMGEELASDVEELRERLRQFMEVHYAGNAGGAAANTEAARTG